MSQDSKAHTNSLISKAHEIDARTFPSIISERVQVFADAYQ